ncbi:glutathione S-transferase T3-like [Brachypodium distachyon]|uniref:glutathione S-transferase T3-like n=1 Tax=Brachypodium distachyon TaxID=15368 RepID=UPI000D0D2990|nr:glutathione S-transferase T3-like [Brachypodium distachyon]|eukprot:XP_024313691.1 glutathione S-transferase T3-like [Brachypodium distachyon]
MGRDGPARSKEGRASGAAFGRCCSRPHGHSPEEEEGRALGVSMDSQDSSMGLYTNLLSEGYIEEAWGENLSNQFGAQPMQAEVPTPPVKVNNKRKGNFSDKEDEVLVAAWLHASMDPIVGAKQKSATYWNRIHEEYELHKPEGSDRSVNSLSHRWSVLKEQVGRFCGCYDQIMHRHESGKTEQDKIVDALKLFKSLDKTHKGFVLLHCWNMMRFEQKWLAQTDRSSQSNKKQKSSSNASPSMSTHETNTVHIDDFEATSPAKADHMKRPIGKKAEKVWQRRGKNVTSSDDSNVVMALDLVFSKGEAREMARETARQARENAREASKKERYEGALAMEQKKIEIEERKMEMEIMNKDLSSLDDDQKEYYRMLRRDIIDRRSKRSI